MYWFPERDLEPPDDYEAPDTWVCPECGEDANFVEYSLGDAIYKCPKCGKRFEVLFDRWAFSNPWEDMET